MNTGYATDLFSHVTINIYDIFQLSWVYLQDFEGNVNFNIHEDSYDVIRNANIVQKLSYFCLLP